jgi:B12 binding domain
LRVLLVSENRCRDNLVPYPLGISWVGSHLEAGGHEVSAVDLMFSDDPAADVRSAIRAFDPQVIGVSIRNIDNQDRHHPVFFPEEVRGNIEAIKEETAAPIVLGGAGFTIFPLECLEYFRLELGVVGEGEETFLQVRVVSARPRRTRTSTHSAHPTGPSSTRGGTAGPRASGAPPSSPTSRRVADAT